MRLSRPYGTLQHQPTSHGPASASRFKVSAQNERAFVAQVARAREHRLHWFFTAGSPKAFMIASQKEGRFLALLFSLSFLGIRGHISDFRAAPGAPLAFINFGPRALKALVLKLFFQTSKKSTK
jgi:hypothetical protein